MPDRSHLVATYRDTRCELACAGGWQALDRLDAQAPGLVLTAWNPDGAPLPPAVNRARDAVLRAELDARNCAPLRARGRSADGAWFEDGWLIPHLPERSLLLLRRYGQLAGFVFGPGGRRLLWATGEEQELSL